MQNPPRRYRFDRFVVDEARRALTGSGRPVELRPKSFDVLCLLLGHAGRLVTKEAVFEAVWPGIAVSDESLARCVSDIRLALRDRDQRIVKTMPGRGYLVAVPVAAEWASGPPPEVPPPLPDGPSVAVLPFQETSGGESHVFADGMTEDLTAALCRLGGVLVIARASMSAYRGPDADVRVVGREVGARYVLEGSVRASGGRLRVGVRLHEAATARQIWAETYDRPTADLFAVQDEIAVGVAARIGTELMAAEYARASRKPPQALGAWECVVRALFHASQQSETETRAALALLDRALELEPGYARALGMQAWIQVFRAFQGWEEMGDALASAQRLIARALASDNGELWPYLAQAMVGFAMRDDALSMAALGRAVALSPGSVNAHGLLSIAHAFGGRTEAALASIAHAMRLSPRDTFLSDFELYNAFVHLQAGRYEEGLRFARQAHLVRPGHAYPLLLAAACAGHLGRAELGGALLVELRLLVPSLSADWVEATAPYVRAEDRARLAEGLLKAGLGRA